MRRFSRTFPTLLTLLRLILIPNIIVSNTLPVNRGFRCINENCESSEICVQKFAAAPMEGFCEDRCKVQQEDETRKLDWAIKSDGSDNSHRALTLKVTI